MPISFSGQIEELLKRNKHPDHYSRQYGISTYVVQSVGMCTYICEHTRSIFLIQLLKISNKHLSQNS